MGRLRALELSEISVVEHPANRKRFLLLKQHDPTKGDTEMPDMQLSEAEAKALEIALCTPLDKEDELLKAAGDLPADKLAIAKGLLRLSAHTGLKGDALQELAAKAGIGFAKPVEKADPEPKPDLKPDAKPDPEPKPTPGLTKADVDVELKKRDETIEKQQGQITALTANIAKRDADDDDRAVAALVAEHGMPGDKDNLTKLVKSMSPEMREMWASSQKSARAALALAEKGTRTIVGAAPESAQAKLNALIASAVQKAGDKPDMDAILKGIDAEHPDIFADVRAEAMGG